MFCLKFTPQKQVVLLLATSENCFPSSNTNDNDNPNQPQDKTSRFSIFRPNKNKK